MNQQNNLGRWTKPTTAQEVGFYARNVHAIDRYSWSTWAIQLILAVLAYNPVCMLLGQIFQYLPSVQPIIPYFAVGILLLLHYVLHEELLEALSNWRDDDDKTNNTWHNYAVPLLIVAVMVAADIMGARMTIYSLAYRDTSGDRKTEWTAAKSEALAQYRTDSAAIVAEWKEKYAASAAQFAPELTKIKNRRVYDAWDIGKRKRDFDAKNSDLNAALSALTTQKNDDLADLRHKRDAAVGKAEVRRDKGDATDEAAKTKAELLAAKSSWVITVVCWIIFLFMSFRLVELRVRAGIRKNVSMTDLDATGSFFEKFWVATLNVLQRQGHRFLVWYHQIGSLGTSVLHDFDGRVVLKASGYNGGDTTEATPPTTGGNKGGQNGNDGGGGSDPTPPTALPPTGGNAQRAPRTGSTEPQLSQSDVDVEVATLPSQAAMTAAQSDLGYTSPMTAAQTDEVLKLATAYDKPRLTPPSVPTASPTVAKTPAKTQNPVEQPPATVQQSVEFGRLSELDDKIERLRLKIQENGESHFKRGDAKNVSVAKRIFGACDEAYLALKKGGEVCPSVLSKFKGTLINRLDIAERFDFTYDSRADLEKLIAHKEVSRK